MQNDLDRLNEALRQRDVAWAALDAIATRAKFALEDGALLNATELLAIYADATERLRHKP
jgi:hypothetical protein